jgi:hypothetical protein
MTNEKEKQTEPKAVAALVDGTDWNAGDAKPKPPARAKGENAWGYPSFAKDFPENEELWDLVDAFARGDYKTASEGGLALAKKTDDDAVKKAALVLAERTKPDPTSRVLFVLTATLLAFLSVWWMTHDGPPKDAPPAPTVPVPTVEYPK